MLVFLSHLVSLDLPIHPLALESLLMHPLMEHLHDFISRTLIFLVGCLLFPHSFQTKFLIAFEKAYNKMQLQLKPIKKGKNNETKAVIKGSPHRNTN